MASLFWVAKIGMINGPAVPVARTVKLPLQAVTSVLPVGERMGISAENVFQQEIDITIKYFLILLFY
jgi:hypothetical protein